MAISGNNLRIPEDLLAELEPQAASQGVTVGELAAEVVRTWLRERPWQARLSRWSQYGERSGFTAEQVPEVVEQWRTEQHGR